jgi:hypothetical protein
VFLATETSKLGNLVGFGTMMGVLITIGIAVTAAISGKIREPIGASRTRA